MKKIYKHLVLWVLLIAPITLICQTTSENSVVSKTYRKATQNPVTTNDKDSVAITIGYVDGLGRPKQTVAVQAGGVLTHRNTLLYDWTLGNTGSTPFYNMEGLGTENTIVSGTTPFGDTDLLWECKDDNSSGGSGWITDNVSIDHTKAYRYTTWVKRTVNLTQGAVYHGPYNVNNLDGTANSNPYFWYGDLPQIDTWYLLVGIVHPSDHTGGDTGVSGVYDTQGNKVIDGTEFTWPATGTTARFRNYMFSVTDPNVRQYFWSPLVQKMDGTELPIDQVIQTPEVVLPQAIASDIVTPMVYDQYGRQMREYLPYTSGYTDGRISSNAVTKNGQFYLDKHGADFPGITDPTLVNAYSEKTMENSPLGRIYEQTAPGSSWIKGSNTLAKGYSDGHTIKFEYHSNDSLEVKEYTVTTSFANKTYTPSLTGGTGYYPKGELTKTITKDENWTVSDGLNYTTEEFKNKNGQVVLKRTYADIDFNKNGIIESGDAQIPHDTYYIYDDYGNLTYVLPPKAEGGTTVPTTTILDELCYQYVYDYRNRLIHKKIPGKGWEYIIYDKLDRPVMTQDAIQAGNNKWLFTKYDRLGRVVYTGIYDHGSGSTRAAMQSSFDSQNDLSTELYETKVTTGTGSDNTYYTQVNFPSTNTEILTINYYDNYYFDLAGASTPTSVYSVTPTTNVKSLATGSRVRILGTTNWTTTVTYYDEKARPIYIYSKNDYLGSTDIVESKLDDFTGRLLETKTTHQKTGKDDIVTIDTFTYDHRDRLITQTQKVNDNPSERIVQNHYDELGQLESKLVGNGTQQSGYIDVTSGISISGNTVTKTSADGWNEGLATLGSLQKDGYISFEITQTNIHFMVGLSNSNTDANYTSIDYAIYSNARNVSVYEKGVHKGTFDRYAVGDIFKVERILNTIYYLWNDEIFYISTESSSEDLLGDVSLYTQNGSFTNLELVDNSKGLQKVDYTYNVRGWLKNINNDSDNDNDLFNFNLRYNVSTGTPLYNGNISQIVWNTANTDSSSKAYTFTYDALNRIRYGQSNDVVGSTSKYSLHSVFYDKNGNIENLYRNGHKNANPDPNVEAHWGLMDNLIYTYDTGNKLMRVTDYAEDNYGFKDGNKSGDDFVYDVNGNMIQDKNKGITSIEYNHLNLPTKVTFDNVSNKYISYTYDAAGIKLKKQVNNLGSITTTDYAGNYVYQEGDLQFFNHAEGYVNVLPPKTQGGPREFRSVYQYKDHLGNVRLSYADTDNDGSIGTGVVSTINESNFDNTTSTTPWLKSYGQETLIVENDRLKCTIDQNYRGTYINMNLVAGKTYTVQYDVDLSGVNLTLLTEVYGATSLYNSGYSSQQGYYTFTFTAAATAQYKLRFYGKHTSVADGVTYSQSESFYIDNVSVYEYDAATSEIIEESNYYPFGLKHKGYNNVTSSNGNATAQKFKYNGKEFEEVLGLNLYEMDVRMYDPAIARFNGLDPVIHYSHGTSIAFDNNPIFFADPSGANSVKWEGDYGPSSKEAEENEEATTETNGSNTTSDDNSSEEEKEDPPGDYYDKDGNYVGSDNKKDDKVYIVTYKTIFVSGIEIKIPVYNYIGQVNKVFTTGDKVTDKRIQKLHPAVRMFVTKFIREANSKQSGNTFIRVSQGFRTNAQQNSLYAQGRTKPGAIVTNARGGYSNHNFGLAFDIVGITNGNVNYNLNWTNLSSIGNKYGFSWGGNWKNKDLPHFENTFGNTTSQLRALKKGKNGFVKL